MYVILNTVVVLKHETQNREGEGMYKIKERVSNFGVLMSAIVLLSTGLMGCFEGYTGADGDVLLAYLAPSDLRVLTENPDPDIWLIDVRPNAAYQAGHIPTALSYPSTEIASRLGELPLTQYLIVHCETGIRAQGVITDVLEPNGYTRFMNWGGVTRWPYALETGP
jgi:rhodanese-related sulfurtransferase